MNAILSALTDVLDTYNSYEGDQIPYVFSCSRNSENFRSIYLLFGNYWFVLKPEDYIFQGGPDACAFNIVVDDSLDHWVLGVNFLRGWYAIHDYEN